MTPVRKDKRVPTEAVQSIVKIRQGIKEIIKTVGEIIKRTPTKAANPLPPLKLRKQDQLCPITARIPQKTCTSKDNPKYRAR